MNGQNSNDNDMVKEKSCILSLSAEVEAFSAKTRVEEEYQQNILMKELKRSPREEFTVPTVTSQLNGKIGELTDNADFYDSYETPSYILICKICEKFHESVKNIMGQKAIGMAFEGQNLGRNGVLSLVQIATTSELFIFDIIRLGNEAFRAGLKAVFESQDVMKVIHDCRWIADLLRCQHDISMANIFDTQVANAFVQLNLNEGKWPKYVETLPECLITHLNFLPQDVHCSQITEENEVVWLVRPLPLEILDSVTKNAVHLLRLYHVLLAAMLVEFRAAVEIYLNLASGTAEDVKKYKESSYLLPVAFANIHTSIKNKSGSCATWDQQSLITERLESLPAKTETINPNSLMHKDQIADRTESPESQPSMDRVSINKQKKYRPKKAKKNEQSSKKIKDTKKKRCRIEKDVSLAECSYSHSEWESMSTSMIESAIECSPRIRAEIDQAVATSPAGDSEDGKGSLSETDFVNVNHPASLSDTNFVGINHPASLSDTDYVGINHPASLSDTDFAGVNHPASLKTKTSQKTPNIKSPGSVQNEKLEDVPQKSRMSFKKFESNLCSISKASCNSHQEEVTALSDTQEIGKVKAAYVLPTCEPPGQEKEQSQATSVKQPENMLSGLHKKYTICQEQIQATSVEHPENVLSGFHKKPSVHQTDSPSLTSQPSEEPHESKPLALHHSNLARGDERYSQPLCHSSKVNPGQEKIVSIPASLNVGNQETGDFQMVGLIKEDSVALSKSAPRMSASKSYFTPIQREEPNQCNVCGKIFSCKSFLDSHVIIHSKSCQYSCDLCNKKFITRQGINHHVRKHLGDRPFRCDLCDKSYAHGSDLKIHKRTHAGEKPYQCDVCNKRFVRSSHLYVHQRVHSGVRPYKCSQCNKRFRNVGSKIIHEKRHTEEKPHKCDVCNKAFKLESDLIHHKKKRCMMGKYNYTCAICGDIFHRATLAKEHKKIHPPYKCDICHKYFSEKSWLKAHERVHEKDRPKFECNVCQKVFTSKSALGKHKDTHLIRIKQHTCDVCEKAFYTATDLNKHKIFHSSSRPHLCDLCGKGFITKNNLNKHIIAHSGEKPYGCDICEKSYNSMSKLRMHKRIHLDLRPYMCEVCNKRFTRIQYLTQHKLTHIESKPYKCHVCSKTFARSTHRNKHLKAVHYGDKPYKCDICHKCFVGESDLRRHKKAHL